MLDRFDLYIEVPAQNPLDAYDSDKVQLLLNYPFPGIGIDVPDPWGKSEAAFHEVYDLIDHACDAMIKELTSTKQ